ncbi:uncharacterized protein LOC109410295 isoform X2 [Aedes albopictus]|uniref:Uncharacterized protein n=1 Tax=Aedes albopictus TaxID=7160 RepID=A0ABM1Z2T0_AEDAL
MAFYNRDNVFTRAKQAKKRIHIDFKQDDQAADILSAPHIPHREAESEKALNHTPKHEALFDTDDPIHCKRKRGEDTTVKPADDSSEDLKNSLPTSSHQEEYLEPKIETVIESTVPFNDNFEVRVQFNQENVFTKITQAMKRKEDDSKQDIQLLQQNADTATSTELHLRASVIGKNSEDIQSNVLRAGSSTEKRVEGIAHRPAEDSVQETLPTRINPNSRLHPPDSEVHSTTRTTYGSGETVGNTYVNRVSYNRDNVFTKAKQEKRRNQSNLEGKDQIHHRPVDIPTGSGLHLDAVANELIHTSYLGMQYDIDNQTSLKKQACEVDDSVNSVDSRLTFSSVVPTDPGLKIVANKMSSSSDTPSTIHEQIVDGCGYSYKKTENCSLHVSVEPTHLENSQICDDWSLISLSNVPSLYTERMDTSKTVDSLKPEIENVDYFIRTTKSKCQDPTDMIDFESDSSLQPQNTTPTLNNAETQLQIRNSNVFGEETNTTMSSGNTKANRVLYNRDNVFTKAKQQKRRNQSNLEGQDQIHHRIAEVPTGSGMHFDAVDNEFKHTTYLEGQYGINGRSSMTQHAREVDDSANTVGSRLTSSSVLTKDPVVVKVPNDMSSPSNTANIMNATTSSGNTSVNRVLYNRDNVFTRAKQEKRRNQRNLEEKPQIHHQTADIPTGSGLHLDAVDNEFMHTSYLGVQPDISSIKKQKMEVDDSVNSIDPRLNISSVVPTDAVFDKVQNETGLSFETGSIMNATTSSGNTSVNRVLYNRDNVFTRAKQEKRRNQRNLEEKPEIHHQTADIPTGSGLHLDAVDNEFMHTSYLGVQPDISSMKKQKMEVDDSVNSIDSRLNLSSVVPRDAVFDKVQNETDLSFKTGSIMNATTSSGNTSANRVLYNRDNVFTRAKQEKRRNQMNLEERPQIHYQTADIPTGSGLHLDAVDNEFMHTSYLGVQPDISSMKEQKMEVDDSVNSIDPRLNLSSVVPTDAVFDKAQNETGLSFKTGSIMNATTSSGNTSVNRVLYNRDNVFTRAKQEKRRNQRNLEERPQIHHQTADIPTGSGLHLDAVDNEYMHTSYLGVQSDISSMKKQKMEVDDSVNSIDPRLNLSSVVPTDAVFDKVQNETGLSCKTGSIILKQITVGCEGHYREAENCSQHESFEQANLENSPNCDDWSLISLSNV